MAGAVSGFLGFGRFVTRRDHFIEAPGYGRHPIIAGGPDHIAEFGPFACAESGPLFEVTHGGIYNAVEGGHLLAWFPLLPPFVVTPEPIPRTQLRVFLDSVVQQAVHRSQHSEHDPLSEDEPDIARGQYLGTANCQELRAGIRLVVSNGCFHARANFRRPAVAA
jgi:hypothetical protein